MSEEATSRKRPRSFRLSADAEAALSSLAGLGYDNDTQALEAALLAWNGELYAASARVEQLFDRQEWNLLADSLNSPWLESWREFANPARCLALEVADAHRLNRAGHKWLGSRPDGKVEDLVARLDAMSTAEAWAVLLAVSWFWQHEDIDPRKDSWWTVAFRQERAKR